MAVKYHGLRNYIKWNSHWFDKWENQPINLDSVDRNSDEYYVRRAVVLKDIPELRSHPSQYQSYTEYLIHKKLLRLQNEFKMYDLRNCAIRQWFYIRRNNILKDINQIRIRDWWYKALNI